MASEASDSPNPDDSTDFVQRWLQHRSDRVHPDTLRSDRAQLERFTNFLADSGKDPITAEERDVRNFFLALASDGLAESTLSAYRSTLAQYYRYIEHSVEVTTPGPFVRSRWIRDRIRPDTFAQRRNPQAESHKPLSQTQCKAVIEAADRLSPRHGFVVLLLAHTGMRRGELANLTFDWFDPEKECIRVPTEHTKNARARVIPLPGVVVDALRGYLDLLPNDDGLDVSPRTIYRWVREASDEAEVGLVSPRRLRHTFVSRLLQMGVRQEVVTGLLGHKAYLFDTSRYGFVSKPVSLFESVEESLYGDLDLQVLDED